MTRVLDLGSLQIADRVQDTLLVLDAEQKSFEGRPYTVLTFGNATGRLPSAPFCDKALPYVEGVRRGHVVQVIGEIAEYRGRRQLRVTAPLRLLPEGAVDLSQLLPTVGDVTRYWEVLDGWRREIKKPRLAQVLALFYEDDEFRARYGRCPASINGHHAAIGGLGKQTAPGAPDARALAKGCGAARGGSIRRLPRLAAQVLAARLPPRLPRRQRLGGDARRRIAAAARSICCKVVSSSSRTTNSSDSMPASWAAQRAAHSALLISAIVAWRWPSAGSGILTVGVTART